MKAILIGAGIGVLFGLIYPTLMGGGGAGAEQVFAFKYGMFGGVLGFTLQNYARWRQRVLDRVAEQQSQD